MTEWLDLNRANWNERVQPHVESEDYGVGSFVTDLSKLSDVVRFDVPRLGDVAGLRAVHLQCHIGTDTISLERLGAQVTGIDFSPAAIAAARSLAHETGSSARFVLSTVQNVPDVLDAESYDLVYTGVGALCWLPSIEQWAGVVEHLLAPGGRLFLREGHPVLWSLADAEADGELRIVYPYFETVEPTVFDEPGTYVATDHVFEHTRNAEWNHGLGEIVGALLDRGLRLTMLVEHDTVPWDAIPGRMEQVTPNEYRLRDRPERLPHSYTLQAIKPS